MTILSFLFISSLSFLIFGLFILSGDHSEEETPVPIPNTEVKLFYADDTASRSRGKVGSCQAFFFIFSSVPSGSATPTGPALKKQEKLRF